MEEMGRKTPEMFRTSDKLPLVLVLDNVRSMMNTGSVFRTADAFLIKGIVLCGITAIPPHREIQKTALGATETVAWKYMESTVGVVEELKKAGFTVVALEQTTTSRDLRTHRPGRNSKYALIFGNEVRGVAQEVLERCDYCLEIPQFGTKHSMNISVTAGVVVWDFFCKWQDAS